MDGEALSSSVSTLKPPRAVKRAAFAGRVFDVARDELLAGRATVPLGPKARLLLKYFLDHRDAFSYDNDNPSNPYRYLEPPSRTRITSREP